MIYTFTIIFGLVFAVTHVIAEWLRLYWHYSWLDMPMHVMGGVLAVLIISSLRQVIALLRHLSRVWLVVVLCLVLLAWEAFGIYRFGGLKPDFWSDSLLDLLFGFGGIVCGYVFVRAIDRLEDLAK